GQAGLFHEVRLEALFQVLVSVHPDRNRRRLAWLGVNEVAALRGASKSPSVLFKELAESLSRDDLHTSISSIAAASFRAISSRTAKHPSKASTIFTRTSSSV